MTSSSREPAGTSPGAAHSVPPSAPNVLILDTMLGWTKRHSRSQGEQLAELLTADGYAVRASSRKASRLARLADMVWALLRRRRETDVTSIAVFSGPAFWLAEVTSRVAWLLRIPIVLVLHGGALPTYAPAHPRRVKRLFKRATCVVAPSGFNANALNDFCDKPIHVVANVVDFDDRAWKPRPKPQPNILWMRSLQEIYGPELALDVLVAVQGSYPQARLTMAGPDKANLTNALKARCATLGIEQSVSFTGFLDAAAKSSAFADHDIFLNTSRIDNTPVALLEAAAHGLAVVSTNAGGIPDLFQHGTDALLSPVGNAQALAGSIGTVLDDPERAAALAARAQELVRSMTWQELAPQWGAIFAAAKAGLDTPIS